MRVGKVMHDLPHRPTFEAVARVELRIVEVADVVFEMSGEVSDLRDEFAARVCRHIRFSDSL
jgi:hypothetical protein